MKNTRIAYMVAGLLCLGCVPGITEVTSVNAAKKAGAVETLPALVARQWACRRVEPFGIRQRPFAPGACTVSNGIMKLVNKDTMRIQAVYTNRVLTGDFSLKARFKGGSYIGLVKADASKGLLGFPIMGSLAYTLEITRTGSEVTMLLDGIPFPYRNYGVRKNDAFQFGVLLNKNKTCEIYGFECTPDARPAGTTPNVSIKAQPFPLDAVSLLTGRFKNAMEINKE